MNCFLIVILFRNILIYAIISKLLKLVFYCFLYIVVYTCCVPGCKTGYKSEKDSEKHTLFGFPNDEKLRQNWIAAIPC